MMHEEKVNQLQQISCQVWVSVAGETVCDDRGFMGTVYLLIIFSVNLNMLPE